MKSITKLKEDNWAFQEKETEVEKLIRLVTHQQRREAMALIRRERPLP